MSPRIWEMTKYNIEGGAGESGVIVRICHLLPLCYVLSSPRFWETSDQPFPGSLSLAPGDGKERTLRTRLQPTRLLNEFHIILQFVTAVTCGSFLGTQLQRNNTPAVSVDTAVKAKPKRFQFIISVRIFQVKLLPTSLVISPKLEISRNLSGRKEAKE